MSEAINKAARDRIRDRLSEKGWTVSDVHRNEDGTVRVKVGAEGFSDRWIEGPTIEAVEREIEQIGPRTA